MATDQLVLGGMPPALEVDEGRVYDRAWHRVRSMVLARDNGVCHYCGGMADTVDHVTCIADGGARLDPANLVAACRPCNSRRSAERTNRRRSIAPQSRKW